MLVNFVQFTAQLIIALVLLRVAQVMLLKRNPESSLGKALAFVA